MTNKPKPASKSEMKRQNALQGKPIDEGLRSDAKTLSAEELATQHADNVKFAHTYMGDCFYSYDDLKSAVVAGFNEAKKQEKKQDDNLIMALAAESDEFRAEIERLRAALEKIVEIGTTEFVSQRKMVVVAYEALGLQWNGNPKEPQR